MHLSRLSVENCRIVSNVVIEPCRRLNVFIGGNGSGKSSMLEAIHLLSFGRSFRTRKFDQLIHSKAEWLRVVGKLVGNQSDVSLGIERYRNGDIAMRYNNDNCTSLTEFATYLPALCITPDSFGLLHDGPKVRRSFMDWGVFHAQPNLGPLWQRLSRLLKQRNAALKKHMPYSHLASWDQEFARIAEQLSYLRSQYVNKLVEYAQPLLADFLGDDLGLQLNYFPGWRGEQPILLQLEQQYARDLMLGYSSIGPHKADLHIKCNKFAAQDVLSRGQQKLVVYALKLAQGQFARTNNPHNVIYLVDDLSSELDSVHLQKVLAALVKTQSQVWLTAVDNTLVAGLSGSTETKKFVIAQGHIRSVAD